jgi:hypothetical protein
VEGGGEGEAEDGGEAGGAHTVLDDRLRGEFRKNSLRWDEA